MGKGGGTSVPSSQTVTQTNLPEYFKPFALDLMKRAQAESMADYVPYEGQRIADESADLLASRDRLREISGQGIAGLPEAQERIRQGLSFDAGKFDTNTAQQYMSPYMQQVVDIQKQKAISDAAQREAFRDDEARRASAFGGSRAIVQDAAADKELTRQLAEIQATGQQKAFEDAQSQFERDRTAAVGAEKIGLGSAESLAALGQRAREGDIQAAGLLEQIGKGEMAFDQSGLDLAYQDFLTQRDAPRDQLNFLSSILRGIPVTPSQEQQNFKAYNPLQDLLGSGISAYGLYKGFS